MLSSGSCGRGSRNGVPRLRVIRGKASNRLWESCPVVKIELGSPLMFSAAGLVFRPRADGSITTDCHILGVAEMLGEGIGMFIQVYILKIRLYYNCLSLETQT